MLNFVFGAGFTAGASKTGAISTPAPPFDGSGFEVAAAAGAVPGTIETGVATSEVTLGAAVAPLPLVRWAAASGFLIGLVFRVELGILLDLWYEA